jgi:translation initiation factor 4G
MQFEDGFNGLAELLFDLAAVDMPKTWSCFSILLRGPGINQDEERREQIARKEMNPEKLNGPL